MRREEQPSTEAELEGRVLGDFVVCERIGEGGFGAVYRARQPALEREAVIKVLHGRHHANEEVIRRFMRESRLASRLEHPYAAHVYAFGAERDGLLWLAMELVRGTPLDQLLRTRGPMSLEKLVPLLERICEVVHTAHEQGIVHRDLKPANVMVISRAGRMLPKLLDFGIAKLVQEAPPPHSPPASPPTEEVRPATTRLIESGDRAAPEPPAAPVARGKAAFRAANSPDALAATDVAASHDPPARALQDTTAAPPGPTAPRAEGGAPEASEVKARVVTQLTQGKHGFGSPPYMAPEQWVNAPTVGPRTDIYALGVMCYELATGRLPFTGQSVADLAIGHATEPVPPLGNDLPEALDEVLARAMAKQPDERFDNALAFGQAVRAAAGLATDPALLPRLEELLREEMVANAPQPLAEAVATLDCAHSAHQAREALCEVGSTAARLLGILALASRSRVGPGDAADAPAVVDALRALRRGELSPAAWLELARELCRPFATQRDAHPIPELVELFFGAEGEELGGDETPFGRLQSLAVTRTTSATEQQVIEELDARLPVLADLLRSLEFLTAYRFAVGRGDVADSWMGARRRQRPVLSVRGKPLEDGHPVLLDAAGRPVLALWPLVQAAAPSPGAETELFFLAGNGRRGARLVARPAGFELQDERLWDWYGEHVLPLALDPDRAGEREREPYPGLSAFGPDDADVYFGREREAQAFANRLRTESLLAVVGPSGTGKSSFVQAGVVPDLPRGWRAITFRPGAAPLAELGAALRAGGLGEVDAAADSTAFARALSDALPLGQVLVLVVDQTEEMFTLCLDPGERERFAEALLAAAGLPNLRVVLTLRDDFLVRADEVPALRDRLARGLQLLATPAREDLIRIVTEPAARCGFELEDRDLAEEMVDEVVGQPGALALLAFTAARLWALRDRHFQQLTRNAYRALGGVGGALAKHAEATLAAMTAEEQRLTREAFRHLVTSEGTRAVLTREELAQLLGKGARARSTIERLVAARLLVASEGEGGQERVEVVHEALLSAWPRLATWRREDAEGARMRDQLRAAARQWDERDRPRGLLWRGDALAEYRLWRSRHAGAVTDVEAAFGQASLTDEARGLRVRRAAVAGVIAVLSLALVVVLWFARRAQDQRQVADQQRAFAEENAEQARDRLTELYEEQGRQALLAGDGASAAVYLGEAYARGADSTGLHVLLGMALQPFEAQLVRFDGHTDRVRSAELRPDGARVLTASADATARVWDAASGEVLHILSGHTGDVAAAHLSADGQRIITASWDETAKLWDATSGALINTLEGHDGWVLSAEFSRDGRRVVTASADGTARIWDAATAEVLAVLKGHADSVLYAGFSPDGQRVATASRDYTAKLWDAESGELIATMEGHGAPVTYLAFDPTGSRIVTVSSESVARIWDGRDGAALLTLSGHADKLEHAAFSPDGSRVVTASYDRTARVWDATSGQLIATLVGHARGLEHAAFDPRGERVVTSGFDGSARIWDARTGTQLATLQGHASDVRTATFDPSGTRILTGSWDGSARIWSAANLSLMATFDDSGGWIQQATLSSDGKWVVTANEDGKARIWEVETGALSKTLGKHAGGLHAARFSPDDRRVITAGMDGTARVWDSATGRALTTLGDHGGPVRIAEFSPSGRRIATAGDDGVLEVWDADSFALVASVRAHDAGLLRYVARPRAYSPDGAHLVTACIDGIAKIWNAETLALETTLTGHTGELTDAAWSADSRAVVTTSFDKTAKVWAADTGRLLHDLDGNGGVVFAASFTERGDHIVTASEDGIARIWGADDGRLLGQLQHGRTLACASFGRDGKLLVTAGADRLVKLWDVERFRLLTTLQGHTNMVVGAHFVPGGFRVLTASYDGTAKLWRVQDERRGRDQVSAVIRCRVPRALKGERPLPTTPDPRACPR